MAHEAAAGSDPAAAAPGAPAVLVVGGGWREPLGAVGGAVCRRFAASGAHVFICDIDADAATATAAFIVKEGGVSTVIQGDASTMAGARAIVETALAGYARIDTLVNIIGLASPGGVLDAEPDGWDQVMAANVRSVMLMTQIVVPHMPRGSAIVNCSSITGLRPGNSASYAVSKSAIEAVTRAAALDAGPLGIRVNCVRPGEIFTWRNLRGGEDRTAVEERLRGRTVLGELGDSWDIAEAIIFLASGQAKWISGEVLTVDGGMSIKRAELWSWPTHRTEM
jgi:NAD(P)-dependent dehydrogenase (short-subunit alcohol dehydrogenase family)